MAEDKKHVQCVSYAYFTVIAHGPMRSPHFIALGVLLMLQWSDPSWGLRLFMFYMGNSRNHGFVNEPGMLNGHPTLYSEINTESIGQRDTVGSFNLVGI